MKVPLVTVLVATMCAVPVIAKAEIAVFVDGRILKVDDAFLQEDQIILELRGGGRMVVPAVRIARVVADEVEEPAPATRFSYGGCSDRWSDEALAESLPFRESIAAAARLADLNPKLLVSLVRAESAFDPWAESRAGARGLTQLMPAAASDHGVRDPFDPDDNLRGGARHLRSLLDRFAELPLALAAYNAGAATVERYRGVPPYRETREYVVRVLESFCPAE